MLPVERSHLAHLRVDISQKQKPKQRATVANAPDSLL